MLKSSLRLVRAVAGALALCSGVGLALPAQADDSAAVLRSSALTSPGWEVFAPFTIPKGRTDQFIHADCPPAFPLAVNGGYAFDGAGQISGVSVSYLGPRDDIANDLKEWGWTFYFKNGAPADTKVILSLLCTKL